MSIDVSIGQPVEDQDALDVTTEPLDASETYTGDWKDVDGYNKLCGMVYADQACTLYIEQSQDGSNADSQSLVKSISASDAVNSAYSVEVVAPYARMRIVNGVAAQGTLRASMNGKVV